MPKRKIGVIAPSTTAYPLYEKLFNNIIKPDLDVYRAKFPPNVDIEFEFVIKNGEGDVGIHLNKFQELVNPPSNIDLIIGGGWSSQAKNTLEYINQQNLDVLLLSSSSTSPLIAIADDALFRLCPDDTNQSAAIAQMLINKGISHIVVIQRDDAWGNGLYTALEKEYVNIRHGNIYHRIVYPPDAANFDAILTQADDKLSEIALQQGINKVAIQIISFSEAAEFLKRANQYPTIYNVPWFGSDGTAMVNEIVEEAPMQAARLKVYSTYAAPQYTLKYEDMAMRYYAQTGRPFSYYTACNADIAWILAQAVLESRNASAPVIKQVLPDIASRHFGYSGWCLLNDAGDRLASDYEIWGYKMEAGVPGFRKFGSYSGASNTVTWE